MIFRGGVAGSTGKMGKFSVRGGELFNCGLDEVLTDAGEE